MSKKYLDGITREQDIRNAAHRANLLTLVTTVVVAPLWFGLLWGVQFLFKAMATDLKDATAWSGLVSISPALLGFLALILTAITAFKANQTFTFLVACDVDDKWEQGDDR